MPGDYKKLEQLACDDIVRFGKVAITADGLKVSNPELLLRKVALAMRASGFTIVDKEEWDTSEAARKFFGSVLALSKSKCEVSPEGDE